MLYCNNFMKSYILTWYYVFLTIIGPAKVVGQGDGGLATNNVKLPNSEDLKYVKELVDIIGGADEGDLTNQLLAVLADIRGAYSLDESVQFDILSPVKGQAEKLKDTLPKQVADELRHNLQTVLSDSGRTQQMQVTENPMHAINTTNDGELVQLNPTLITTDYIATTPSTDSNVSDGNVTNELAITTSGPILTNSTDIQILLEANINKTTFLNNATVPAEERVQTAALNVSLALENEGSGTRGQNFANTSLNPGLYNATGEEDGNLTWAPEVKKFNTTGGETSNVTLEPGEGVLNTTGGETSDITFEPREGVLNTTGGEPSNVTLVPGEGVLNTTGGETSNVTLEPGEGDLNTTGGETSNVTLEPEVEVLNTTGGETSDITLEPGEGVLNTTGGEPSNVTLVPGEGVLNTTGGETSNVTLEPGEGDLNATGGETSNVTLEPGEGDFNTTGGDTSNVTLEPGEGTLNTTGGETSNVTFVPGEGVLNTTGGDTSNVTLEPGDGALNTTGGYTSNVTLEPGEGVLNTTGGETSNVTLEPGEGVFNTTYTTYTTYTTIQQYISEEPINVTLVPGEGVLNTTGGETSNVTLEPGKGDFNTTGGDTSNVTLEPDEGVLNTTGGETSDVTLEPGEGVLNTTGGETSNVTLEPEEGVLNTTGGETSNVTLQPEVGFLNTTGVETSNVTLEPGEGVLNTTGGEASNATWAPSGSSRNTNSNITLTTDVLVPIPFRFKITNLDWVPEFEDFNSAVSKHLRNQIEPQLNDIFDKILGTRDPDSMQLTRFVQGSVIVEGQLLHRNPPDQLAAKFFEEFQLRYYSLGQEGSEKLIVAPESIVVNGVTPMEQKLVAADSSGYWIGAIVALVILLCIAAIVMFVMLRKKGVLKMFQQKHTGQFRLNEFDDYQVEDSANTSVAGTIMRQKLEPTILNSNPQTRDGYSEVNMMEMTDGVSNGSNGGAYANHAYNDNQAFNDKHGGVHATDEFEVTFMGDGFGSPRRN